MRLFSLITFQALLKLFYCFLVHLVQVWAYLFLSVICVVIDWILDICYWLNANKIGIAICVNLRLSITTIHPIYAKFRINLIYLWCFLYLWLILNGFYLFIWCIDVRWLPLITQWSLMYLGMLLVGWYSPRSLMFRWYILIIFIWTPWTFIKFIILNIWHYMSVWIGVGSRVWYSIPSLSNGACQWEIV